MHACMLVVTLAGPESADAIFFGGGDMLEGYVCKRERERESERERERARERERERESERDGYRKNDREKGSYIRASERYVHMGIRVVLVSVIKIMGSESEQVAR